MPATLASSRDSPDSAAILDDSIGAATRRSHGAK